MSHILLIKRPAHLSLRPRQRSLRAPTKDTAQLLSERFPGSSAQRYAGSGPEPFGHYRLDFIDEESLFVKIVPQQFAERQVQANRLMEYLAERGVAVQRNCPGFPQTFADGVIFAYPWLPERFAEPSMEQMAKLGKSLAHLHGALRDNPLAATIRANCDARMQILQEARQAILNGKTPGGPIPDEARAVIISVPWEFSGSTIESQPLHGDLNLANVLFRSDEKPVFLDFEDALYSWYPPVVDLAFVLERFVLVVCDGDEDLMLELGNALLGAYVRESRASPFLQTGLLSASLRWLAARSLLSLAAAAWRGHDNAEEEWRKFIYLEKLARERALLLATLEEITARG